MELALLYLGVCMALLLAIMVTALLWAWLYRARTELLFVVAGCAEASGLRHWIDYGTLEDWVTHRVALRRTHHLAVCIGGEVQLRGCIHVHCYVLEDELLRDMATGDTLPDWMVGVPKLETDSTRRALRLPQFEDQLLQWRRVNGSPEGGVCHCCAI